MADVTDANIQSAIDLRRCILSYLYDCFKTYPRAAVELRQINETCKANSKALNWNMVYLEKKGWIELDRCADCPPYVACTAVITGAGIDLVEDTQAFESRFGDKERSI